MPRDCEKSKSPSSDRVRFSPYNCNSNKKEKNCGSCDGKRGKSCDLWEKNKGQWEESRCPICLDHPHKAVLLICSSHEKGCQPYLCHTGHRLSNCFDQFCELHAVAPLKSTEGDPDQPNKFVSSGGKCRDLLCPLCRGQIKGWIVVESAREFMNGIVRNCALDSCEFSGNYVELKNHAKVEHPSARPSQVIRGEEEQDSLDEEDELDETDYDDEEEELDDWIPLGPGDDFSKHIHFANEDEDEIVSQEYCVTNGIFRYRQSTKAGKTYEYSEVLGEN